MPDGVIKRALISVYDKTGVVEFATVLVEEFGIEIISTGGTARLLEEHDLPVTLVEVVTGCSELMDGRVKTLHPKIHAAILADRDNPEHMRQLAEQGIQPIDMVVVNLYPFEKTVADPDCTFEQAIDMIDIGGPCMLRAAAKNHRHVFVACEDGYRHTLHLLRELLGREGRATPQEIRARGAMHAFRATTNYDAAVTEWLSRHDGDEPFYRGCFLSSAERLRYGENPHQVAEARQRDDCCASELGEAEVVTAVDENEGVLSYNNFADSHAALELCKELARELCGGERSACVFVKHTNACGVAVADTPLEAYQAAYLGDPNAAMGGILACSFPVGPEFAEAVMETYDRWGKAAGAGGFFVEVWLAPDFDVSALEVIRAKKPWGKRARILAVSDVAAPPDPEQLEYKSITNGMLLQTRDLLGLNEDQWKVVTDRPPEDTEMDDLRLAWVVCKHTKSNAITICKEGMLIGNGAGQMSRVMSCRIATWMAKENGHADKLPGSAAASDAFFPFTDGPEILIAGGVTAIIQPGGSKRDADTIDACNRLGVAMIHTGTRHFKH